MTTRATSATLTARIQARLHRAYAIEEAPPVDDFIVETEGAARETLRVREGDGELEVEVALPRSALLSPRPTLDELCQVVEGVSHFLCLAERARRELPATQLELEIQAEVDKYVVLVLGDVLHDQKAAFDAGRSRAMRARLFERVVFLHDAGTERGERYRVANDVGARVARGLERWVVRSGSGEGARAFLRRFYAAGQREKMELVRAA
ncbi:MAG: hypothetical protein R3B70_06415 [Polyangiaceae bacterium]